MTSKLDLTSKILNDPMHWHKWAEEARILADQMRDPDARRLMIGIAESYEHLAAKAEERLRAADQTEGNRSTSL